MTSASNTSATASWLGYCRAGFEPDLAAEFTHIAGAKPVSLLAVPDSGYVLATFAGREVKRAQSQLVLPRLVFARQCLHSVAAPIALPTNDRVTPIMAAARAFLQAARVEKVGAVMFDYPDTNEGKAASKLALALEPRIAQPLAEEGLLTVNAALPTLHVLLTPNREAFPGLSDTRGTSPWRNGIPRLRMPHDAPSRSTLKLAEAIYLFLGENDERLLRPEMRAVDLGAAPGGWTWQLVHRGLHVTAVDNGPLKGELVDNALVRHLREDGFRYRPRKPVDWMVCDMVEKPARIAQLVALWLGEGWTDRCIFNLKLPMKKRWEEVQRARASIGEALQGIPHRLRMKHLYHDREEVTAWLAAGRR